MASRWWLAIRPKTLPAALAPLVLANALAIFDQIWDPYLGALSLVCALGLQILVNLANDLSDAQSGVDTHARLGPTRVTQSGLISPTAMRWALGLNLLLVLSCGIPLFLAGGLPLAIAGVCSVIAAFGYSAGPYPLANHGLGELAVLVFFGWVAVGGGYWVHAQQLTWAVMLCATALGLSSAAIMLVNNTRDRQTDIAAGKRTLATRISRTHCSGLYGCMLFIALVLIAVSATLGLPKAISITAVIGLFPAMRLVRAFHFTEGKRMNVLLARTALFTLYLGGAASLVLLLLA